MGSSSSVQASIPDGKHFGNANDSYDRGIQIKESNDWSTAKHKLARKLNILKDKRKYTSTNNITIKRSNNVLQALDLPTIVNLNPRSVYNKIDEFHALVEDEDIDITFMSESWEREDKTLDQIIHL